jgi:hypothetical protein
MLFAITLTQGSLTVEKVNIYWSRNVLITLAMAVGCMSNPVYKYGHFHTSYPNQMLREIKITFALVLKACKYQRSAILFFANVLTVESTWFYYAHSHCVLCNSVAVE